MSFHGLGSIDVIALQDLATAGLLWAAAHLLKHVRRLRNAAAVRIPPPLASKRPIGRATVYEDREETAGQRECQSRTFTAAAG